MASDPERCPECHSRVLGGERHAPDCRSQRSPITVRLPRDVWAAVADTLSCEYEAAVEADPKDREAWKAAVVAIRRALDA